MTALPPIPDPASVLAQGQAQLPHSPAGSLGVARQLEALARQHNDDPLLSSALYLAGRALLRMGRAREALSTLLEAVALCSEADLQAQARCWHEAAVAQRRLANDREALEYLGLALQLHREAGDQAGEIDVLDELAAYHTQLEAHAEALSCYRANLQLRRASGDLRGLAQTLLGLGRAQLLLSRTLGGREAARAQQQEALGVLGHALQLGRQLHDPALVLEVQLEQARLQLELGQLDAAEQLARTVQHHCLERGERRAATEALLLLADVLTAGQHPAQALHALLDAQQVLQTLGTPAELARLHLQLSAVYEQLGEFQSALQHHRQYHALDRAVRADQQSVRAQATFARLDVERSRHESELHRARGQTLEQHLAERTLQLEATQIEMTELLASAAEFRDAPLGPHARWVGEASAQVALRLGWSDERAQALNLAARLHDIGKIAIPDRILLKEASLSASEWAVMREHTVLGARLLAASASPLLQLASTVALSHHEQWDGGGYPHGLSGEQIPLPGRIVAVVDTYDALVSERPYKPAWTPGQALQFLRQRSGRHFDPEVVRAFCDLHEEGLLTGLLAAHTVH
ncbi:HD domain-containing phosphohydrolase [Deinococcus sonorensis]|uniref:HD domain-containing phosphohydrolase n=2 Tax=Deinococcus sonorensis TaxID=309891 RepID=A0AAU7UBA0_9DEIO